MLKNKIQRAAEQLALNLKGKVVLTEAATGAYAVTPILAALAGAEVYAYTKTTRYGTVEQVSELTHSLANQFGLGHKITVIDKLTPEIIGQADIITNSGHLRPLDKQLLQYAKKGAVIPLMYEAWERRDADLDLYYCREQNILLGATNERHPDVDVFNYLGDMALKMIFDAGECPYNNKFLLICNNDFGPYIAKVLSKVVSHLGVCDEASRQKDYEGMNIDWIGNFPDFAIPEDYRDATVIFTAHPFEKSWIGDEGEPIGTSKITSQLNAPLILRYAGDINEDSCKGKFKFHPEHVSSGHMGILPSAIGYDPIIRLQAGGLKAGELLLKKESHYRDILLAEYI